MQRVTRENAESTLSVPQRGRLRGQARRGTSLWLQEPLTEGEATSNATWSVMVRQRLMMPCPGSAQPLGEERRCGHLAQQGHRCAANIDDDGIHENLCNLGGGPGLRHDQVKEWLAEKLKESFGGRTHVERSHPLASGRARGRMDIKHDSSQGHLDIDVTIVSIYTSNSREALRRQSDPNRALRAGAADKLKHYGPGVIAFVVDDTGSIGAGALRLLRRLATMVAGGQDGFAKLMRTWRAELQHVVLQATARMAQTSCSAPRTA